MGFLLVECLIGSSEYVQSRVQSDRDDHKGGDEGGEGMGGMGRWGKGMGKSSMNKSVMMMIMVWEAVAVDSPHWTEKCRIVSYKHLVL